MSSLEWEWSLLMSQDISGYWFFVPQMSDDWYGLHCGFKCTLIDVRVEKVFTAAGTDVSDWSFIRHHSATRLADDIEIYSGQQLQLKTKKIQLPVRSESPSPIPTEMKNLRWNKTDIHCCCWPVRVYKIAGLRLNCPWNKMLFIFSRRNPRNNLPCVQPADTF